MTIHLLNAAVMPQPGFYELVEIGSDTFAEEVKDAHHNHDIRHYIGYKSTLTVVEQMTGIDLGQLNFEKVTLQDGDLFYVIRLKYRATQSEKKEDTPEITDFEDYKGSYAEV